MSIASKLKTLALLSIAILAPAALAESELVVSVTTKPSTNPSTQPGAKLVIKPATKPAAPSAKISKDAQTVLDEMSQAYSKLNTLVLSGSITGHFDVAGQKGDPKQDFKTSYQSPNKFRNDMQDSLLVGSTGSKVYAFNKEEKKYAMKDAPQAKVATHELPAPLSQILALTSGQSNPSANPSLMLALSKDPAAELSSQAKEISKADDVKIADKTYTALKLAMGPSSVNMTLLIDPETHLLKRVTTDLKDVYEKSGAPDVRSATIAVNYDIITTDGEINADDFAWTPPTGAKEAVASGPAPLAAGGDDDANPAAALEGKPAPNFTLNGLDGKPVTLADWKGSVVVLDFWATWCPPCRKSLPHLNQISEDKDMQTAGLKVFAIDLNEDKDKVQGFINDKKFTFGVLLDTDGAIAKQFNVSGIPQTVIVGRDGTVKKVFVGFGDGSEELLKKAIQDALKEAK